MVNSTGPTTTTGKRMRLIDEPAHVVLEDGTGREVSDRIPGRLWMMPETLGHATMMFHADEHPVVLSPTASGRLRAVVYVGKDSWLVAWQGHLTRGDHFTLDWDHNLEAMV